MTREQLRGSLAGLGAAALFGASAPLSKLLLPSMSPLMLAALLYLGAGVALTVVLAFRGQSLEAPLRRADRRPLAGILLLGGVVAPVLMLAGLQRTTGVAGSLLLNLEGPFTILLALAVFREHAGPRALAASALIVGAGALLSIQPGAIDGHWTAALLIGGACACWAIDNNLSQRLSLRDPVAVVRVKALGAGALNLGVALVAGERLPGWFGLTCALLLGSASYGLSIVLDMHALRRLGAAREAAYFATAPFVGALLAIPLLGDRPTLLQAIAAGGMVLGVVLLLRDPHDHLHSHDAMEHEHLHSHDEHHRHDHRPDDPKGEPHSHIHRHVPLLHDHPHFPDLHHRHRH